ncbi:serine hydrolase domain-containing protein [Amycolatopsis keratiniphila]|uniref:Serine hydrolase n=1 Tax=Amycolatopsis keratiniphila subsp. keratiniphila TaxID=227715 RepID=A0A1W2LM03_9PSEU|nr:serine hydrolase domain-containing protein [Amycolatopsis keratiniphila]OLZ46982.1 serine hydrolase [Amycolatopsis keratiniphila subsp. nogabecina]ONF64047.1 serine hydrolase [Amycolatopsis keratiniphila subsp. keratiniphila]SDU31901.1 D-alanyl-D-alanine carboxypeptidase [Amycolatopsis keratiniphila]
MRKSLPGKKIIAVGSLVALLAATTATPALAVTHPRDEVDKALKTLVQDGVPGAQATVSGPSGRTWSEREGVGNVETGTPFPHGSKFRAASITKTFVAVVVLQLVAEGKVRLDAPIDRYLPGLVHGNGNDGTKITVRQLLQHTSGIYNYLRDLDLEEWRHRGAEPEELVAIGLAHPPLFAPGTDWSYSNTNYIIAGMLIEKLTGRSVAGEIRSRITGPLGLRDTSLPSRGDENLPYPHARGYGPGPTDYTEFDPSAAGASGGLISTGADLNRFYGALVDGRLLPRAQLAEMQRTVPAPVGLPGAEYGLGIASVPLSCGGRFWGHGGNIVGYANLSGAVPHGRRVNVVVNLNPAPPKVADDLAKALDTGFCAR